jgi:hypothetical protein
MPNATVRANARTLPEPTEPPAEHKNYARIQAFSRAYARWLKVRAQIQDPQSEDEDFIGGLFGEERSALRELFLVPAACSEAVWAKLEAFEADLVRERVGGEAKDFILLLALGSIKSDLINLGIIKGDV